MAKNTADNDKIAEEAVKSKKAAAKKASTVKKAAAAAKKNTAKKSTTAKKTPARKPVSAKKTTAAKKSSASAKAPKPDANTKPTPKETVQAHTSTAADNDSTFQEETANQSSARETMENTFPGLDKDRDWQSLAIRVLYIAAFGVLGWLAFLAAIVMTAIQVVLTILLGTPNETLQSWVCSIGKYLSEVFEYISWRTEERPFPLDRPAPLEDTSKS